MSSIYQDLNEVSGIDINTSHNAVREEAFEDYGIWKVCQSCEQTCKQYKAPHSTLVCYAYAKHRPLNLQENII